MSPSPGGQIPLDFEHRASLSGDDFLISPCNRDAVAWLDKWPDWPAPALVIYGPPGCGKTHLANVFMEKSGGVKLPDGDLSQIGDKCILDDADDYPDEEHLLHAYNILAANHGHLLLTAARPPSQWQIKLADLASRLNAVPAVEIRQPDDMLIKAVLAKLFSDRQLRVEAGVVDYIVLRMERSLDAARRLVAAVDGAALAAKRNITLPLVRDVMAKK